MSVRPNRDLCMFCIDKPELTYVLFCCPWIGAIKLEGGQRVVPQVEAIANAGIAVVGHIGLTPQVLHKIFLVHALSH